MTINTNYIKIIVSYTITLLLLIHLSDIFDIPVIQYNSNNELVSYTAQRTLLTASTTTTTSIYDIDSYWIILVLSPIIYAVISLCLFIWNLYKHYCNDTHIHNNNTTNNNNNNIIIPKFTLQQKLLFVTYKCNQIRPLFLSSITTLVTQLVLLCCALYYGWNERCGGASGIVLHWLLCMRLATIILSIRITVSQLNTRNELFITPLSDKACQLGWSGIVRSIILVVYQVIKTLN